MHDLLSIVSSTLVGLTAGIYFSFSVVVMPSLDSMPREIAIDVMNRINSDIVSSLFMPLFWLASFVSLLSFIFHYSLYSKFAGAIYLAGMLLVTAVFNVPLNNKLAEVGKQGNEFLWDEYMRQWTRWNHVRAISSTIACALFIVSLK